MSGVKTINKQALHHFAGQRLVSIQEAVHMVDNQELVISSNKMTYLSFLYVLLVWGVKPVSS